MIPFRREQSAGPRTAPQAQVQATVTPAARELPLTLLAHDREQIELQLSQSLASGGPRRTLGVELHFFIPRNVGLSSDNYPRVDFYGDLTTFARVDLPAMSLEELADDRRGRSPLVALDRHRDEMGRGELPLRPVTVEVKLFGHLFTEALRDGVAAFVAELQSLAHAEPAARWHFLDDVDRFAVAARAALAALRRARRRFEPLARAAPIMETLDVTDEYSSLFLDGQLAVLAYAASARVELFDGSGFVGRLRQTLARHAQAEAGYRTESGYLNLGLVDGGAEYFAYRQSLLKKAVQQALYVDTRRLANDRFVRNTAGAVAAGIAATWALVAQLPSQIGNLPAPLQTALLAVPVLAYVAKDRIKELTRDWLLRRVKGYDNDVAIAAGSLADAGLGHVTGRVRERMEFVAPEAVPAPVRKLRLARRTVRSADPGGESVLRYLRTVDLDAGEGGPAPTVGFGLRQIIRLNLRKFLVRMDDPRQRESHFSSEAGCFVQVPLPKVYHVNLIARVTATSAPSTLSRWRIVIDKEGIVRLDLVGSERSDDAEFAAPRKAR